MHRIKALLSALAITIATVAAWIGLTAPAQAATCYWYSGQAGTSSNCDNRDPDALGSACGSDAQTVKSVTLKNIYTGATNKFVLDLRYSGNCRTAWARLRNADGASPADNAGCTVWIHRNSDGQEYSKRPPASTYGVSIWTNVVYDADVTSYARAYCDTGTAEYEGRTANW
ncbi:hypothetical protein SRB5_09830 [Streptomyces sp. RB5]|uniref:DUF2690 domain-containing protein n=1 Tax=Streptomyces smaragdinus TaxID=2585196 RepID=A0A7K0CBP0_9ACTN|nr:DUF2690 domain-containing protein [Streptomyces smaragdinus]MQY10870.1 hypothetical protein [Streptomyces smaragdinus]